MAVESGGVWWVKCLWANAFSTISGIIRASTAERSFFPGKTNTGDEGGRCYKRNTYEDEYAKEGLA